MSPESASVKMLGIECSCDETSAAVVARDARGRGTILSNVVRSQDALHRPYGGVVPELAARAHLSLLDRLIVQAMDDAQCSFSDLDGVAATAGPGLAGGLLCGVVTAKAISLAADLPFYAINHLEAHALTPGLTDRLKPPYLMLLVSGGHTQLLSIDAVGDYARLGTTVDDALGEAFDKTAKLLGLGYPGGPAAERAAARGCAARYDFPIPMKGREGCNFSFSGLKTAVRQCAVSAGELTATEVDDICAAFQAAAIAAVADRVGNAMDEFSMRHATLNARPLVVSGGVGANQALRQALDALCRERDFCLTVPPAQLCTDNAAMVAWAGLEAMGIRQPDGLDFEIRPRWPLDPDAPPQPYAGVKA